MIDQTRLLLAPYLTKRARNEFAWRYIMDVRERRHAAKMREVRANLFCLLFLAVLAASGCYWAFH
jgi:hypothetical protein